MLVAGTQMHIVTFLFICTELVILLYLLIFKLARPDDHTVSLNMILISLLIFYNLTGGLLPDPKLPGSYFVQTCLAYATGFITPCYFPYYVYRAFSLKQLRFHAFKGVFLFLIFPYLLFVLVFAFTGKLEKAKDILFIPTFYAVWVILSLYNAVRFKYGNKFTAPKPQQERLVLMLSLTPWAGLPIIDFFDLGQALEASITNIGFLGLFAFVVKQRIADIRLAQQKLAASEQRLKSWNKLLQVEVDKRTRELARINEQQMNTFINLAHETKTPLTLVNNYIAEYIGSHETSDELAIVKANLEKLSADIGNLFDLEKFKKGFAVYNHCQTCNISEQIKLAVPLFHAYAKKKQVRLTAQVTEDLFVKADPLSINRIINNVVENAIKFSGAKGWVHVLLRAKEEKIVFVVTDTGPGVPKSQQKKIFEPYYQIGRRKMNAQGMGLGLPIVKRVVEDIGGTIDIDSEPAQETGTEVRVVLPRHVLLEAEPTPAVPPLLSVGEAVEAESEAKDFINTDKNRNLLLIEDNKSMTYYLAKKLSREYNVYTALNGQEALKKLNDQRLFPDLIITDVMMDKLDGFSFAAILANKQCYNHIPIIFITAKSSAAERLRGLRLGAIDFIEKPFLFDELHQKVNSVLTLTEHQRKAYLSTIALPSNGAVGQAQREADQQFHEKCADFNLTAREKEIARFVCKGYRTKAIGQALFISDKTVSKHLEHIFGKVGVTNKLELIYKLDCPD